MTLTMLPTAPKDTGRLSDVFISALGAIVGGINNRLALPRVDSALVVLIDGLGVENLKAHSGHARNLSKLLSAPKATSIRCGFPSSTAVSLTSLGTGLRAGTHGILGYQTRSSDNTVRNLLSGWSAGEDSRLWQPNQTIAELGNENGVTTTMVGHSDYEDSGFTKVFMSGADFIAVNDLAQRAEKAHRSASAKKSLVYLYFAELDQAAHRFGVASSQWLAALEAVDSAVGILSGPYGLIVTADHGVIDVVPANHIYLDSLPGYVEAVTLAVGDPRALYCYGDLAAAKSALTAAGTPCYMATFEELLSKGWVQGTQTIDVVPDFVLIARGDVAFYDRRTAKPQSLKMIGQHGAIDDRETRVPLLLGGAFA